MRRAWGLAATLAVVVWGCNGGSVTAPTGSSSVVQAAPPVPVVVQEPPEGGATEQKLPPKAGITANITVAGSSARLDFSGNGEQVIVLAVYSPPGNGAGALMASATGMQSPLVIRNFLLNTACGLTVTVQVDAAVGPRVPEHGDFHGDQFLGATVVTVKAPDCPPNQRTCEDVNLQTTLSVVDGSDFVTVTGSATWNAPPNQGNLSDNSFPVWQKPVKNTEVVTRTYFKQEGAQAQFWFWTIFGFDTPLRCDAIRPFVVPKLPSS